MRFSLIAAPLELGCGTTGCAMGGAALVSGENGLLYFLTHNGISASADSAFVPMTARREEEPAPHYLPEVVTACCATRDAVSAAQGEGAFPVTLGGDHALGLGTVAGTAQHYSPEELSLVWVDAHTDINTENSSLSGNIHGMPIAALLGLCGQELSSVCGGLPVLRPENVHIIFARDIDPAEERIIAEQGVHLYRMSEIKEQGLSAVLHRLLGNITTPFCHVSWDVDSLDASFIPATGLPIPDGPDPKAVTDVLLALAASGKMVALDCVEYNPARDSDGSCCRTGRYRSMARRSTGQAGVATRPKPRASRTEKRPARQTPLPCGAPYAPQGSLPHRPHLQPDTKKAGARRSSGFCRPCFCARNEKRVCVSANPDFLFWWS